MKSNLYTVLLIVLYTQLSQFILKEEVILKKE